jgi:hypothetical protein
VAAPSGDRLVKHTRSVNAADGSADRECEFNLPTDAGLTDPPPCHSDDRPQANAESDGATWFFNVRCQIR